MDNNEQLRKYQESRNRPDYRLYVTTGLNHSLKMTSKDEEYLRKLGTEWKRLDMIDSFSVIQSLTIDGYDFT